MLLRGLTGLLLVFVTVQGIFSEESSLEFFPQELYLGEPATFGFSGKGGMPVTIQHDGKELFSGKFDGNHLEASTTFPSPGLITIFCGPKTFRFQLIGTSRPPTLNIKDGFMYTGEIPVILALMHRHPPKHERKWEVLNILKKLSSKEELPAVRTLQILSGSSALKAMFKKAGCGHVTTVTPAPKGTHEIDHLITQCPNLKKADLNLMVLNDRDLNLGLTQERLRMRLEWLLQACLEKGPFMVTSISLSRTGQQFHGAVNRHIKLASLSNRAAYLPIPVETSEAEVNIYILKHLNARVVFK